MPSHRSQTHLPPEAAIKQKDNTKELAGHRLLTLLACSGAEYCGGTGPKPIGLELCFGSRLGGFDWLLETSTMRKLS